MCDNERFCAKKSAVQSCANFRLKWDSNPGPYDPKSRGLTTRPPRCIEDRNYTLDFKLGCNVKIQSIDEI